MVAIHLRPRSTTTATSRSDIVNGWRDWCAEGGMPYRRCHKQDRHREIVRAAFPSGEGFAGEDSKEPRLPRNVDCFCRLDARAIASGFAAQIPDEATLMIGGLWLSAARSG